MSHEAVLLVVGRLFELGKIYISYIYIRNVTVIFSERLSPGDCADRFASCHISQVS